MQVGSVALLYCSSYYTLHGGHSGYSTRCGMFYVYANNAAAITSWAFGATLSLLHIMLFVVIVLMAISVVEFI